MSDIATTALSPDGAPPAAGDADIAAVAALYADATRARMLVALADGRSLPAGVLAAEAGVSPQAASSQLARLRTGGLILEERSGRHHYYRLASARVAAVLELLAAGAPALPITSLRQGTRAAALARTCYDHLAGRLGCALTQALLDQQVLEPTDGVPTTIRRMNDRLSAPLADHPYRLGPAAEPCWPSSGSPRRSCIAPRPAGRCCGSAWTGASSATTSPAGWGRPCSP